MFGFSNGLISRQPNLPILIPVSRNIEEESSDGEGTSQFISQAMQGSPVCPIPRTRSKTKADSAKVRGTDGKHAPIFAPGDLVFAHKGKIVPCWFPGVILEQGRKGLFKVNFLADFGQEFCSTSGLMHYDDFEARKKLEKNHKLFDVPKKFELNFKQALVIANEHSVAK